MLQDKRRLFVDSGMIQPGTSDLYDWEINGHYIDFSLRVPSRLGFDAILPARSGGVSFDWKLEIDLKQSIREFYNIKGDLGFDPCGRMLFIGKHGHELVFMAMAPTEFVDNVHPLVLNGYTSGPTHMNATHSRMATCIFLWCMGQLNNRSYNLVRETSAYVDLCGPLFQYHDVATWVLVLNNFF